MNRREFLLARIAHDTARLTGPCTARLMLIQPGEDDAGDPIECEKSAGHADYHGTLSGPCWSHTVATVWEFHGDEPLPARVRLAEVEAHEAHTDALARPATDLRDAAEALVKRWDDVATCEPPDDTWAEMWDHRDAQAIEMLVEELRAALAVRPVAAQERNAAALTVLDALVTEWTEDAASDERWRNGNRSYPNEIIQADATIPLNREHVKSLADLRRALTGDASPAERPFVLDSAPRYFNSAQNFDRDASPTEPTTGDAK